MVSLSEIKASNARLTADTVPRTTVFVGATAGIGKATLALLVSKGFPVKVYVVGRNGDAHKAFLDELRKVNDKAELIWLEGQVSLLADTSRVCDEIKRQEKSIDLLCMSAGFLPFEGRKETSEGLEVSSAIMYYSRMLFTLKLLPLLNASTHVRPRVVSILAGGWEISSLDLDDFDLKKPGRFGVNAVAKTGATYTTLTLSRLAKENPNVVFIHNHPGVVHTDILKKGWGKKWYGKLLMTAVTPLATVIGFSAEDAGERTLYLATSARYGEKGVPLEKGHIADSNMAGGLGTGAIFDVNDKFQSLRQEKVMEELKKVQADEVVWQKTQEVLGGYL